MKSKLFLLMVLALMFCAVPVFAQGGGTAAGAGTDHGSWVAITSGFAIAVL